MIFISLTFEVPLAPPPVDKIREWAFSVRDRFGKGAGSCHVVLDKKTGASMSDAEGLDGLVQMRVRIPREEKLYYEAADLLVVCNLWCIREARNRRLGSGPYPPLFQMATFEPEDGAELWGSIESIYQRGVGDCEDLACARIAERVTVGDACRPKFIRVQSARPGRPEVWHVLVQNPDGTFEDPSKLMMGESYVSAAPRSRTRSALLPHPRRILEPG